MYKKDLIQRQFEEFGLVLARILGFKRERDWAKFEEELAMALREFSEQEVNLLEEKTPSEFESNIILNTTLSFDKKKIIARLLFEKMLSYEERGNNENYNMLKQKCLLLYSHLREELTHQQFDLEIHYHLESLKNEK